jgi:fumarate reductase subunit C
MSDKPAYNEYHPRWHRTRVSTYWWMKRPSYVLFILREVSSVFVAWSVVYLLLVVRAVHRGRHAYSQFLIWSSDPLILALNGLTLFFLVLHAVTWFNLAPQALVMHVRGERVPARWIALSNYAAWAVVTAGVAYLLLRR